MYVIFPADDVVEESYFSLVAQEQEGANPTGVTSTSFRTEEHEAEFKARRQQQQAALRGPPPLVALQCEGLASLAPLSGPLPTTPPTAAEEPHPRIYHNTEREQRLAEERIQFENSRGPVPIQSLSVPAGPNGLNNSSNPTPVSAGAAGGSYSRPSLPLLPPPLSPSLSLTVNRNNSFSNYGHSPNQQAELLNQQDHQQHEQSQFQFPPDHSQLAPEQQQQQQQQGFIYELNEFGNSNLSNGNTNANNNDVGEEYGYGYGPDGEVFDEEYLVPQFHYEYKYEGRVSRTLMMSFTGPGAHAAHHHGGGGGGGPQRAAAAAVRDLIHPTLTDPLRQQQQVTFRLVKTGRK